MNISLKAKNFPTNLIILAALLICEYVIYDMKLVSGIKKVSSDVLNAWKRR